MKIIYKWPLWCCHTYSESFNLGYRAKKCYLLHGKVELKRQTKELYLRFKHRIGTRIVALIGSYIKLLIIILDHVAISMVHDQRLE